MTVFAKRNFLRRENNMPIIVVPTAGDGRFLKGDAAHPETPAKMVNQCKRGIYFEADDAFLPGANISIRVDDPRAAESSDRTYTVHRGRVKWCRPVAPGAGYGIGVEIFETVLQAAVTTTRMASHYDA